MHYITEARCTVLQYFRSTTEFPKLTDDFLIHLREVFSLHVIKQRMELSRNYRSQTAHLEYTQSFNEYYEQGWIYFFKRFGTHFIDHLVTGSNFRGITTMERSMFEESIRENVETTSAVEWRVDFKKIATLGMSFGASGVMSQATKFLGKMKLGGITNKVGSFRKALKMVKRISEWQFQVSLQNSFQSEKW